MNKIEVKDKPLTVPAGAMVKLDPDQARRRAHKLEPVKGKGKSGQFLCLESCVFKVGETFETDYEESKGGGLQPPAPKKKSATKGGKDTKPGESGEGDSGGGSSSSNDNSGAGDGDGQSSVGGAAGDSGAGAAD